ncbi:MAG: hypothetical protein DRG83_12495 [Deltaproteobacteria bacterium]|nr:MAG: hypothetical protein DRG83_12495 [Deltaproteobacteria bacterium]
MRSLFCSQRTYKIVSKIILIMIFSVVFIPKVEGIQKKPHGLFGYYVYADPEGPFLLAGGGEIGISSYDLNHPWWVLSLGGEGAIGWYGPPGFAIGIKSALDYIGVGETLRSTWGLPLCISLVPYIRPYFLSENKYMAYPIILVSFITPILSADGMAETGKFSFLSLKQYRVEVRLEWAGAENFCFQPGVEIGFAKFYDDYDGKVSFIYGGVSLLVGAGTGWQGNVKVIYPPDLIADVWFSDETQNGNNILESGEKGEVVVRVCNNGKGDADNVKLLLSIPDYEFRNKVELPKSFSVGKVKAGEYKIIRIPIKAKENLPTGEFKIICTSASHKEGEYFETETYITTKQVVPPYLTFDVVPFDDNQDNCFNAGEIVGFKLSIRNSGRGEAYKVKAFVKNDKGEVLDEEYLGLIKPAEKQDVDLRFQMPLDTKDGVSDFIIGLTEAGGYAPEDKIISVNTSALKAVVFEEDITIDDDMISPSTGDGEGDVDKGETIELRVNIRNRGSSVARGVKATIQIDQEGVELLSPESKVGNINPQESKEAVMVFTVKKDFAESEIRPRLVISEQTGKFTKLRELKFEIGKPQRIPSPPPPRRFKRPNTYALVIGINRYENKAIQPLSYAEKDALEFYNTMIEYGGVEHIYLLLGKDATHDNIVTRLAEIENMVNRSKDTCFVYIFFSGHGGCCLSETDKRGPYLLPYNVDRTNEIAFQTTSIPISDLKNMISRMKAKVFIAVNACYSTAPEGVAPFAIGRLPEISSNGVIISAADFDQLAHEYKDYQHSIFAYYLLQALRGETSEQIDKNNNGWVEVDEIFNWISKRVDSDAKKLFRVPQNPQIWPKKNYANFKVTKIKK